MAPAMFPAPARAIRRITSLLPRSFCVRLWWLRVSTHTSNRLLSRLLPLVLPRLLPRVLSRLLSRTLSWLARVRLRVSIACR